MVTTLVIADEIAPELTAGTLRDIDPDLVLSAGDLPFDYVEWVASTVRCQTVYVPGNHDPENTARRDGAHGAWGDVGMIREAPRPHGVLHADLDVVQAAGLTIAGLGGCVRYREGPHQYTQRQYVGRANKLMRRARRRGPVDVLLTHAPPYNLGDQPDRPHVGIEALHTVLARLEPTWHLHGHIHPYGLTMPDRQVGRTTLRNVIPWRVLDITPRVSRQAAHSA